MISTEDAITALRLHDTLSHVSNRGNKCEVYHSLSFQQAQQIAELILYLSSKCDLEVNEILGGDIDGSQ